MQRKLLVIISVDFDATGQLLISFSYLQTSRKCMIHVGGRSLFGIRMKLVRLIIMCQNETCSRVQEGKHLCDVFRIKNGLKQGDAFLPLLFTFALGYAIRMIQVNQDDLKLNGTLELLVYADDINIMGRKVHAIKKNTGSLVVASKETELEVNADKSKYMVMSRDQNVG